jgi:hypothetical protein
LLASARATFDLPGVEVDGLGANDDNRVSVIRERREGVKKSRSGSNKQIIAAIA